jgi:energy-coupling factor transport system ATP-binding protein
MASSKMSNDPIIDVRNVSYRYPGSTVNVLDHVNLTIHRGDFVALIGQNGAGKTTLAKTFNGLFRPKSGDLLVDGLNTRTTGLARLARVVGYVYQNPDHQIFANSVREEVAFGPRNLGMSSAEVKAAVDHALELVEMTHEADSYPFVLGRGQRQKLAVASVIAMNSPVIVVDEPTTGLDLRGAMSILNLLRRWNADGRTIIVITHDMDIVAEFANRCVVMTKGKVVADGDTRTVLTNEAVLAEAHLTLPRITKIAQMVGIRHSFPRDILTIEEFRAALTARLSANSRLTTNGSV